MNPTNVILLRPSDVLFFRDGRPMEGALPGNGAAWPLPNVTDAAFHAALHRSGLKGHSHDHRRPDGPGQLDSRRYGSLVTAGPFPVRHGAGRCDWYFPRPADLQDEAMVPTLAPTASLDSLHSSLPDPLEYAVANRLAPSKDGKAKAWLRTDAYARYLRGVQGTRSLSADEAANDGELFDAEATVGIGIDADTGTTGHGDAEGRIYSARYLRLRDAWRVGVLAKTDEKDNQGGRVDLIRALLEPPRQILVGGQQRVCTATRIETDQLPLPLGLTDGFNAQPDGSKAAPSAVRLVKWVLLSPAIWPEIEEQPDAGISAHPGGWLPNWICPTSGRVLLKAGDTHRQERENRDRWRQRIRTMPPIGARLVAAIVPKAIPVTGWALANEIDRPEGGAKSTHLAVPAGAVYYFEADSEAAAQHLAAALNWHGAETEPTRIINRRSTLMGEKGFGLGVCGTWQFHETGGNQ